LNNQSDSDNTLINLPRFELPFCVRFF